MKQITVEVREIVVTNFQNGTTPNKKFNAYDERWIVRKLKENPKLSAPKLSNKVEKYLQKSVNPETVRRVLRKNNFHGRTARNKLFVSDKNKKRRLEFARQYLTKDFSFWKEVIFPDESKFNLFHSDSKVTVWCKPNEEFKIRNMNPTVKHGRGSVMVWGCMSATGTGNLEFIEGNMDKKNLKSSAEKLGILNCFKFYSDNDPKHTSHIVKMWQLYNCPKVINTPPQSPNLNVIENIWHELEVRIRKHTITNKNDLKKALQEEWTKIEHDFTQNLVQSMLKRLHAVECSRGYLTKY
ncbi:Transposable element Tcb1 transposase [Anthophora plagiata]